MSSKHIVVLGSVRGIASLAVLVGHCLLALPLEHSVRVPLDIVFNQRAAVLVFFVLSGYVLTLSWLRSAQDFNALLLFYVRRLFRILPALWLASALAWVLLAQFPPPAHGAIPPHWTDWFVRFYEPVSPRDALRGLAGIDYHLIPPTWTITIELVGSLALPFIVFGLARGRALAAGLVAVLFVVALATMELRSRLPIAAFMAEFALGSWLAVYRPRLDRRRAMLACAAGAALLFGGRQAFWLLTTGSLHEIEYEINAPIPAMIEALGAALLIAALASGQLHARVLHWAPVRLLGDWSYSFYLLHFAFLRLAMHLLPPMPPIEGLLVLTTVVLALTVPMSALVYRFVELPGMALGRRVTSGIGAPTPATARG